MHILLFYQYYHNPDCAASGRHYHFVKELSKQHRVSIITSDIWQQKRQTYNFPWAPENVDLHHLHVPYDNAMGSKARLKAYASFMTKAIWKGLRVDKPDVIIGSSTPLTAAWAAAKVAQLRRVPWIFEIRDLWPDFPIQMGAIKHSWAQKQLYKLEQRLYKSAAHNIPLSPDMANHVLEQGIDSNQVTTILNGTDLGFAQSVTAEKSQNLLNQHGLAGKKIILYAGTLGRANAIPTILEASRQLKNRDDLHFVVLGSGFLAPDVANAANKQSNLTLLPPAPRHQIFDWFATASVSLVTFADLPVLSTNSPAKFFDSLAAATPVIVTNPGWTKSFIEEHNCGWFVPPEEPHTLVRCIEHIFSNPDELNRAGKNGLAIATQLFDRSKMVLQLESILRQCVLPQGSLKVVAG